MNTNICFIKISADDALADKISYTYESSFPEDERRDFYLVRQLIRAESAFSLYALTKGDLYVGFLSAWVFEKFTYIEHFAIESTLRGSGLGKSVMAQFLAAAKTVVLEVEYPHDEISQKRIKFYERLGFCSSSQIYMQPPYRKGGNEVKMLLMSAGDIDLEVAFDEVRATLYKNVYQLTPDV
jgi:ribosomal protein S18 acetylase RimI-like enzyme